MGHAEIAYTIPHGGFRPFESDKRQTHPPWWTLTARWAAWATMLPVGRCHGRTGTQNPSPITVRLFLPSAPLLQQTLARGGRKTPFLSSLAAYASANNPPAPPADVIRPPGRRARPAPAPPPAPPRCPGRRESQAAPPAAHRWGPPAPLAHVEPQPAAVPCLLA